MAGKSTVLRSVGAVALLAACGLHAPVAAASVPYIDAFMLRNFSADSPLEGKSSFAVEMTEMRYAPWPLVPALTLTFFVLKCFSIFNQPDAGNQSGIDLFNPIRCTGYFDTMIQLLLVTMI